MLSSPTPSRRRYTDHDSCEPTVAIRAALGELAEQITGDMYVVPKRLTSDGFAFTDPTVEDTIDSALRD
jgi:NAD dependent epimerase/dehydratase family enzyme